MSKFKVGDVVYNNSSVKRLIVDVTDRKYTYHVISGRNKFAHHIDQTAFEEHNIHICKWYNTPLAKALRGEDE